MGKKFGKYYTSIVENRISGIILNDNEKSVLVFGGQADLLDGFSYQENIIDGETFDLNGNEKFDSYWILNFVNKLNNTEHKIRIVSYNQFAYLNRAAQGLLKDFHFIFLIDNLRTLFPISANEYLEKITVEEFGRRPDALPDHQIEQIKYQDNYYYSLLKPDAENHVINLFNDETDLQISNDDTEIDDFVDFSVENFALDFFVNECIATDNLERKIGIIQYSKLEINEDVTKRLKIINSVYREFGGNLFFIDTVSTEIIDQVSEHSTSLLKKYWGQDREFRKFQIYSNPNSFDDKSVKAISQGYIVDIIIKEYENSKKGIRARDLFLTAPTGAGKSLLFQLPSFHISDQRDVVIVVSPLLALMDDQVEAIKRDRKFYKVASINSTLDAINREQIIQDTQEGNIDILYLAPELLLSYDIRHFIGERAIGMVVIDEAHLITTWGRDFRVDYWFLGDHLAKIRKYGQRFFPIVSVTATAIYGGENDMVFDTIDSLNLHNPHVFIGEVKRTDIKFLINNYEEFNSNYETKKKKQTVTFLKTAYENSIKTLVYAPYRKTIDQMVQYQDIRNRVRAFHSGLPSSEKNNTKKNFSENIDLQVIATKAFGMGIDLSDIQVVYHHAPSGLLPDYLQEIGRVARREDITGYAALNFSNKDLNYSRILHGLSSIKKWQIKEVLKKVNNFHKFKKNSRNLLISADTFGYIFPDEEKIASKVGSSLMMIEKDYLKRLGYNVLIARPKSLFAAVYASIPTANFQRFNDLYPGSKRLIGKEREHSIVEIFLDEIWEEQFRNISFPTFKKLFYELKAFTEDLRVIPLLKINFTPVGFNDTKKHIEEFYSKMINFLDEKKTFTESDIRLHLRQNGYSGLDEKLANYFLITFSGKMGGNILRFDTVLGIYESRNRNSINNIIREISNFNFGQQFEKYVQKSDTHTAKYFLIGSLMEILELGTFEVTGGDHPMIAIRINNPRKIDKDANDPNYTNELHEKTLRKHKISSELFEHFFTSDFSNETRWNFIEDYFLGVNSEKLIEEYPRTEAMNTFDINHFVASEIPQIHKKQSPLKHNHIYKLGDELTIGEQTKTTEDWLNADFDLISRFFNENNVTYSPDVRDKMAEKSSDSEAKTLNDWAVVDGLETPLRTLFLNDPLSLYNWWTEMRSRLIMSDSEIEDLITRIYNIDGRLLERDDYKYVQ